MVAERPMPDGFIPPPDFLAVILELLLFFVFIILGLVAYFRYKNKAAKYSIILFPIIMVLTIEALILNVSSSVWGLGPRARFFYDLVNSAGFLLNFVISVLCLIAVIIFCRRYIKNRELVDMFLVISFVLYTISSLALTFLYRFELIAGITALIAGPMAYIIGIVAMIIVLAKKPSLAEVGV